MKKKINLSHFQNMTSNRGMTMAHKEYLNPFHVFIADGWSDKQKKFITWWAVGDTERLDLAQILEFDEYETINGLMVKSERKWRINKTIERVKELIPTLRKLPIYEGK